MDCRRASRFVGCLVGCGGVESDVAVDVESDVDCHVAGYVESDVPGYVDSHVAGDVDTGVCRVTQYKSID